MRQLRSALVLGLVVTSVAPIGFAKSARDVGPLADVNEVVLEVMVGDPLAAGASEATPLFGVDHERYRRFRAGLLERLAKELEAGGVSVVEDEEATLLEIAYFGGIFEDSGSSANFFLIEVRVCGLSEELCPPWRTVLGFAQDRELEAKLEDPAVEIVRYFLEARTKYRESRRQGALPPNN